jgi:hypothetical protein
MIRHLFLALGLSLVPVVALADTPESIRACNADRRAEGCATLLTRLMVCNQAPAIAGCTELLALRDEALAEPEPEPEAEPDVTPRAEGELADDPEGQMANGDCPVIDSADWRAVVGPVDGGEGPHLIVTGRVTLPTPGWEVALTPGMADRSAMPVQRVILGATPPDGMAAQVLTDYDLRLETPSISAAPAGQPPYRGVLVMCGGMVLVELTEVGLSE